MNKEEVNMGNFYSEFKKGFGIIAVISILSGLLLLFYPQATSKLACYVLGGIILAQGVLSLINTIKLLKESSGGKFLLVWSFILIGVGMFFIIRTDVIISIIPLIFGLFILASGVSDITKARQLKVLGYQNWLITFIMALIKSVLGMVMVFNPFSAAVTMLMFIGACLIYGGLSSLWLIYSLTKCVVVEINDDNRLN